MASIERVNAHFGSLSVQLSHFRKGSFVWLALSAIFCYCLVVLWADESHLASTQIALLGKGCLLVLIRLSNQD